MTDDAPSLTLLLGGVRAGKSARAVQLAQARAHEPLAAALSVLFVATAQAFDAEMDSRIAAHKAERPSHWLTVEEPIQIAGAITSALDRHPEVNVVIIDCLTLWVSNLLLSCTDADHFETIVSTHAGELLNVMRARANTRTSTRRHWIIVSNEVGLGIVPPTALGRQYRDGLGRANQLVAAAADAVTLMVAGLEMPIKTRA